MSKLTIVTGLRGKTELARKIQDEEGAIHLDTDEVSFVIDYLNSGRDVVWELYLDGDHGVTHRHIPFDPQLAAEAAERVRVAK